MKLILHKLFHSMFSLLDTELWDAADEYMMESIF